MKSKLTISVDSGLLHEARQLAAGQGISLSALLERQLEQIVRKRSVYESARHRALVRLRVGFELKWKPARSRGELHER